MKLTADEIANIANLARLEADPSLAPKLEAILDLVSQMQQVNTDDIEPMAHPFDDIVQRLREDVVTEPNQREACQALAERVEDGVYLVPKVIESVS